MTSEAAQMQDLTDQEISAVSGGDYRDYRHVHTTKDDTFNETDREWFREQALELVRDLEPGEEPAPGNHDGLYE